MLGIRLGVGLPHLESPRGFGGKKGQLTATRTISRENKRTISKGVARKNELIINEKKGAINGEKGQITGKICN